MNIKDEFLKKALRKISTTMENQGMLPPSDFTSEDISLLYSLGFSLYEREDYEEAKTVFQRLVLGRPHERKFWMALGASQQMLQLYEDALTAWAMASFLEDADPFPHFHAAECLLALGKLDDVPKALNDAKKRLRETADESLVKKIQALYNAWELKGRLCRI